MKLDDANIFEALAGFVDKNLLTGKEKLYRKFKYIEAIIRFLNLYCQNELGSGEADIVKVCLWVNSPWFENTELSLYKTQDAVYKALEEQVINNVPLYRLLNISDHLLRILEENHTRELQEQMLKQAEKYPCLKCIWYKSETTPIGISSVCNRPRNRGELYRRGYLDIREVSVCKYCTTLTETGKPIQELQELCAEGKFESGFYRNLRNSIAGMDKLKERWQKAFDKLDNSQIPKIFETFDLAGLRKELQEEDAVITDFGRVFRNKQPLWEIAENLQNAMLVKAMITFVEIYAQSELGSDYIADITAIARYVYEADGSIKKMNCEEDIYAWLEQKIIDGEDMTKFCKNIYEREV